MRRCPRRRAHDPERRRPQLSWLALVVALATSAITVGLAAPPRLPLNSLDVMPPSDRVTGALGMLRVHERSCQSRDLTDQQRRQRIVDLAVQEWSYFGFTVVDYTENQPSTRGPRRGRRRWSLLNSSDTSRVADSIAGYWTVTPEGTWIINNQNERWKRTGADTRWRTPWSAAFISWVMCESGLAESAQFQRAVAHHTYIDQAIRARDSALSTAAFTAHDIGETSVSPGDLLCSGRRPAYRSLADRRRQMGEGARTHCDVVVALDLSRRRILTIGGNVRATVALKLLPAIPTTGSGLQPAGGRRPLFVHLKLRAQPIASDALDHSPALRAAVCSGRLLPVALTTADVAPSAALARC